MCKSSSVVQAAGSWPKVASLQVRLRPAFPCLFCLESVAHLELLDCYFWEEIVSCSKGEVTEISIATMLNQRKVLELYTVSPLYS